MRHKTKDTAKLPKWAQEHIRDLERERETAIGALNEHLDNQTPTPFYVDTMESIGESAGPTQMRFYFPADHKMEATHKGVTLSISLREDGINLQWSEGDNNWSMGEVAFIPGSFQQARLVAKEHMR